MRRTNVMRLLDSAKIYYETKEYEVDENDLSGVHVADLLKEDSGSVFKTLVLKGEKRGYLVFCIPVAEELDLKKAARVSRDKKVELLPLKELLPVTGYVRGGCSPIGMKKNYPIYIEETAVLYERISVSGGQRGVQILIRPDELVSFTGAKYVSVV